MKTAQNDFLHAVNQKLRIGYRTSVMHFSTDEINGLLATKNPSPDFVVFALAKKYDLERVEGT